MATHQLRHRRRRRKKQCLLYRHLLLPRRLQQRLKNCQLRPLVPWTTASTFCAVPRTSEGSWGYCWRRGCCRKVMSRRSPRRGGQSAMRSWRGCCCLWITALVRERRGAQTLSRCGCLRLIKGGGQGLKRGNAKRLARRSFFASTSPGKKKKNSSAFSLLPDGPGTNTPRGGADLPIAGRLLCVRRRTRDRGGGLGRVSVAGAEVVQGTKDFTLFGFLNFFLLTKSTPSRGSALFLFRFFRNLHLMRGCRLEGVRKREGGPASLSFFFSFSNISFEKNRLLKSANAARSPTKNFFKFQKLSGRRCPRCRRCPRRPLS